MNNFDPDNNNPKTIAPAGGGNFSNNDSSGSSAVSKPGTESYGGGKGAAMGMMGFKEPYKRKNKPQNIFHTTHSDENIRNYDMTPHYGRFTEVMDEKYGTFDPEDSKPFSTALTERMGYKPEDADRVANEAWNAGVSDFGDLADFAGKEPSYFAEDIYNELEDDVHDGAYAQEEKPADEGFYFDVGNGYYIDSNGKMYRK